MKNYSKIRMILSFLLAIVSIYICFTVFSSSAINVKLFPVTLILTATILFALNKKWPDYVAFAIFVFVCVFAVTNTLQNCAGLTDCADLFYRKTFSDKIGTSIITLSFAASVFLAVNFFRNRELAH